MRHPKIKQYAAIGRRKCSVARAFMVENELKDSPSTILVNSRALTEFFQSTSVAQKAIFPLSLLKITNRFNFKITVKGGGYTGQAGAISLAIARALVKYEQTSPQIEKIEPPSIKEEEPQKLSEDSTGLAVALEGVLGIESTSLESTDSEQLTWKKILRRRGCLTRDSRKVQRKLYAKVKARRLKQYSKR